MMMFFICPVCVCVFVSLLQSFQNLVWCNLFTKDHSQRVPLHAVWNRSCEFLELLPAPVLFSLPVCHPLQTIRGLGGGLKINHWHISNYWFIIKLEKVCRQRRWWPQGVEARKMQGKLLCGCFFAPAFAKEERWEITLWKNFTKVSGNSLSTALLLRFFYNSSCWRSLGLCVCTSCSWPILQCL